MSTHDGEYYTTNVTAPIYREASVSHQGKVQAVAGPSEVLKLLFCSSKHSSSSDLSGLRDSASFAAPPCEQKNTPSSAESPSVVSSQANTKVYTHNPYASLCASVSTSLGAPNNMESYHSFNATYGNATAQSESICTPGSGAEELGEASTFSSSIADQFFSIVGHIPSAACTARGRHILVSVLWLRQGDKTELIYKEILPHLNTVVLNLYGCQVIRTLIETISTDQIGEMVPYFHPKCILDLAVTSQYTRRVVQTIFERHQSEKLTPLVEIISSECRRIAMMQQGCITIMRIIEYALPFQKQVLFSNLLPVLPALTMDPYGNYVVQCILQNMKGSASLLAVCAAFNGNWVPLSCNKYASNVMEKIVWELEGPARWRLVSEMVFDPTNLHILLQNGFGNFVLQAIIDSSKNTVEFYPIYEAIAEQLHFSPYGHKIDAKLQAKHHALYKST